MARLCVVCGSEHRAAVDSALVAGEPYRVVAVRYGLSGSAVYRHRVNHLPVALQSAQDAHEIVADEGLLEQVRDLQRRSLAILDQAESAGNLRAALQAIREARGNMELLAKLMGGIDDCNKVTISMGEEWDSLRSRVLAALDPYPEARAAVAAALEGRP